MSHEFRGVWITTLFHIDYPVEPTNNEYALKEQWVNLLDQLKQTGLNAVIVQVRSTGDAIYPSQLAPWSEYVTGQQGLPPTRNFDLLGYMVDEAHRRGMEFHAWFNPYRVSMHLDTLGLSPKHVFNQHRDWLVTYGGRLYLNPAHPAVWQHITDVVMEVVTRYNIDAVHFDDYFYPYPIEGEMFPDRKEFKMYKRHNETLHQWRRRNVSSLIEKISLAIKQQKSWVRFGISPFGVWRNQEDDPKGSATRAGTTSFDDLHADILTWLERGWIDYVMPQLYWNIGYDKADHRALVHWWANNVHNRQLIIGHAAFKVGYEHGASWEDPDELTRQINLSRSNPVSVGSCFFSARSILENKLGVGEAIRSAYRFPALLPPVNTVAYTPPPPARKVTARAKKETITVSWKPEKKPEIVPAEASTASYALYRTRLGNDLTPEAQPELIQVVPHQRDKRKYRFTDPNTTPGATYMYEVSSVNRNHQESRPTPTRKTVTSRRRPGGA